MYSTCEVDSVNLFKQNIKQKPVKVIENMRTMVCTSFTKQKKKMNKTQTENTGRKQNVCLYLPLRSCSYFSIKQLSNSDTCVQVIINRIVCFGC